jgi:cytosine/adenosine deaminase-related metal-dependent hydrolase
VTTGPPLESMDLLLLLKYIRIRRHKPVARARDEGYGLLHETGTLEVGKSADFSIWDAERPVELFYRMGQNPLHRRVFLGKSV